MAATAYSKYRLLFGANGSSYVEVNEFKAFTSIDGTGNSVFTGGTALAGASGGSYPPANAFDNNPSTAWESPSGSVVGNYLRYDLPAPVIIRSFYLASTSWTTEAPKIMDLQGSNDGTNWTTIQSFTNFFGDAPTFIKTQSLNLYLGGVALQADGNPVVAVRIYDWASGALVSTVIPEQNGNWAWYATTMADYAVMYKGVAGYRPIIDGPIQPLYVG